MTVTSKLIARIPISDELVADNDSLPIEERLAAEARIEERRRVTQSRWLALPWYVKLYRQVRYAVWAWRDV